MPDTVSQESQRGLFWWRNRSPWRRREGFWIQPLAHNFVHSILEFWESGTDDGCDHARMDCWWQLQGIVSRCTINTNTVDLMFEWFFHGIGLQRVLPHTRHHCRHTWAVSTNGTEPKRIGTQSYKVTATPSYNPRLFLSYTLYVYNKFRIMK